MAGSIMKKVAVAAIVAAGAVAAPSVASAEVWQAANPVVSPYAGRAHVEGRVTWTLANGATTTCDIAPTLNLTNPGTPAQAAGTITSIAFGAPVFGNPCTTSLPGCSVTTLTAGLPWAATTAGMNVTIGGFTLGYTYSGASCAQSGLALTLTGSVTGAFTAGSNQITFTNATGLTTPLGPARLNGSVRAYVENAAGGPNTSRPITLVP